MRTIAIVFALAVVGGLAPAAQYGRGNLSPALLVFAAALVGLLAACLMSGWLLGEARTLTRMANGGPPGNPTPMSRSAVPPALSALVGLPEVVAGGAEAGALQSRPPYSVAINEISFLDMPTVAQRSGVGEPVLSARRGEPPRSRVRSGTSSNGASSRVAASAGRSESPARPTRRLSR